MAPASDPPVSTPPEHLIGVDVGGTKVSVASLTDGVLGEPLLEPTRADSGDALVNQIAARAEALREREGTEVGAVGIGVPSVVEFATGRARSSVNVPLADIALREVLQERLGVPVFVDNDATCAALAEAHDEQGRLDTRNLVMFTVGTGVGGGLVLDGRVYRGATGAAGELGHTLIGLALDTAPPPAAARFPQPGSLEALAAGRALDHLAAQSAAAHPESALGRRLRKGGSVDGHDAVSAAQEGDERAIATLAMLGQRLGIGVANAINTFDPDVVAIGGGVSAAGELLLAPVRETVRRFVLPGVGAATEIRLARSGPEAGVRGAALLAREELAARRPAAGAATVAA